jgi:hypothetical protein
MFRENVLAKPDMVELIASTFVPVVFDYQNLDDPKSDAARFLRPLIQQRKQDQGIWIFTPEGKALGGFVGFGDMRAQTKKVIDDSLKVFGPVAPRKAEARETHPYRGKGVMPDGRVCLAAYVRRSGSTLYSHGTSPVISSITLSEKQFRALAPPKQFLGLERGEGKEWTVPEEVAKSFSRITSPLCYQHAPRPDWVTDVRIGAKVEAIVDGLARLRYEGTISSVHRGRIGKISEQTTSIEGEGVYDVAAGKMRSLLLLGSGKLVWSEAPDKPAAFDALVEWDRDPPASAGADDGIPPRSAKGEGAPK